MRLAATAGVVRAQLGGEVARGADGVAALGGDGRAGLAQAEVAEAEVVRAAAGARGPVEVLLDDVWLEGSRC